MKTITLSAIATSIALAMPALADDAHHPAQPGGALATQVQQPDAKIVKKMQDNLDRMRTQLERLAKAKTPEERQKILNQHMQTMQENMGMAWGMQSEMTGCPMMSGGTGMMGGYGMMGGGMGMMGSGMGMMGSGMGMMGQPPASFDDMMAKRMEMMEKRMDMMQMMMQGRMGMPPAEAPKPAN